jgi:hypothetical protein
MQLLGLILILINIGAIVGPIAGVIIYYQGNVQEMIIPPEVENIVTDTMEVLTMSESNPSNPENPGSSTTTSFAMPQYVSSSFDVAARTVTAVFNLTNPLNITLTVNVVSAEVKCHTHGIMLGHATMPSPVEIQPAKTADLTVVFTWTQAAQEHILNSHTSETTINVDLVNISVSVSGITLDVPETYNVDIPLY